MDWQAAASAGGLPPMPRDLHGFAVTAASASASAAALDPVMPMRWAGARNAHQ
jgi:hypothetical protein